MSKLLAKMNLAYDSTERVEKLRLLSKIISENNGCIIKIVELDCSGGDNVFYIRPGKCIIDHDSNTYRASMKIKSREMLSIIGPGTWPGINEWKHYIIDWSGNYEVTVYDELPEKEINLVERFYKEEMTTLERKFKKIRRDYVRTMKITKNVDWLGDPEDVLKYKPI
jgi:hypothetical protein